jgi:aspartyl-tRNA(Asn)/glutamyl-tRNA(Gln) amidotransferase subunit C
MPHLFGASMSLTLEEVNKIAHLARLNLSPDDLERYAPQLSRILGFIEQMNEANTSHIDPLAHPLELSQRLRPDAITEQDLREKFQRIAPQTEAGLYLVPKVIEEA